VVAKKPIPPEPTREEREVAELEKLIRTRWDEWVERGLVAEMPAWEPQRFLGCR